MGLAWKIWLWWSGQKYPDFRGRELRNPCGAVYTYAPVEAYPAWVDRAGAEIYGKWPPLLGRKS